MNYLIGFLFPNDHPNPFILTVGLCFLWSGVVTAAIAVWSKVAWRRGKKLGDL